MERIILPAIYCPFPSRISPYVEPVQEHSLAWVQRWHLIQKESALRRFASARFAWLAARAHADAELEDLALICDWHVWLFLFDDQFDDGALGRQPERMQTILEELLTIVKHSPISPPEKPIAQALNDFWSRAITRTSLAWQERFAQHIAAYFAAYDWEARNRVQGAIPAIDAYIEHRRNSGSLPTAFDLIDIAQRVTLPSEMYNSHELQTLRRTASNVVCWVNDLFSFQKEMARGEVNNLVLVVQHANQSSLQEAAECVNTMITKEVQLFLDTEQRLPTFSPALDQDRQKYVRDLCGWMRGNLDWSRETPRYAQVEQTASYLEAIL